MPSSVPSNDDQLVAICRFGVGYNMVDIPAATEAGVAVVTTPEGVRRPVATSVMAFLLALTMRLPAKSQLPHTSRVPAGVGLVGRTLGILGMGSIGAEVFRLAKPFSLDFIACDPYADPAIAQELGAGHA